MQPRNAQQFPHVFGAWAGVSDKQHDAFTDKEFNKLISFSFVYKHESAYILTIPIWS